MRNYHVFSRAAASLCALAAVAGFAQQPAKPAPEPTKPIAAEAALFRENRGQWDGQALYLSQNQGLDYWVTRTGVVIDLYSYKTTPTSMVDEYHRYDRSQDSLVNRTRHGHVVRMDFANAAPSPAVAGYGPSGGAWTYLRGPKESHAVGVRSYHEALLGQIYPGIDLRHYRQGGAVRYDLIVRPGADSRQIGMRFTGDEGVRIGRDGNLYVSTSLGKIKFAGLHTYQPVGNRERTVESRFVERADHTIGIEVGAYDPRLPLVIDPLVYGSYVGSDQNAPPAQPDESVNGMAVDNHGNLYIVGSTSSPYFPTSYGAYDRYSPVGIDAFLMKMDADAYSVSYAVVLGGSGTDKGLSIGLNDNTKTLWLTGTTTSTDFAGKVNNKSAGTRFWVSKFDITNQVPNPLFSRYINEIGQVGGTNAFFGRMRLASDGNLYLAGDDKTATLTGLGFTDLLGAATGSRSAFVVQVHDDGTIGFKNRIGGTVPCFYSDLATAPDGSIGMSGSIIFAGAEDTGQVANPHFVTTPGVFPGLPGVFNSGRYLQNANAFVVQMNPSGQLKYSCTLGGAGDDFGGPLNYDSQGNAYVIGFSGSFNYQRTRNVFDQNVNGGEVLTKLSPDASVIDYSTALRSNVIPTAIAIDDRGVAAVGGLVSFLNNANPFDPCSYVPTTPGSVYQTADALNKVLGKAECGLNRTVNAANGGQQPNDAASTNDGFILFMNPSGSDVLYSDYIGGCAEERVNDVIVDNTNSVWVGGIWQEVWTRGSSSLTNPVPRAPVDPAGAAIYPYITANAFKTTVPVGGPINGPQAPDGCPAMPVPGVPEFASSNGWIVKLRVKLPILSSIVLTPSSVAGGNGASSLVTVILQDPAPPGGVNVTLSLDNPAAASFTPGGGQSTTVINIPEAATSQTATVYTLPVTTQTNTEIRAVLDNDFVAARLTISPWLNDFTVSPASLVGGNQLTSKVVLFQQAPANGVTVPLATDRPDLILLGNNAAIQVPPNSVFANAVIDTAGVDSTQVANVSATYLGVTKQRQITLTKAELQTLTFNPNRINRGDSTNGTLTLTGKTGSGRTVTFSTASGPAGALINGQALPVTLTVPPQTSTFDFKLTAPNVQSSSNLVVKASDGSKDVFGTVTIDPIDISTVNVSPGTDVIGGSILTVTVTLTRPAGPSGVTVNLSNSNDKAGRLSRTTVTIPAGQVVSPAVTFTTKVNPTDQTTNIHATKTGFTDRYATVKVRALKMTLNLSPPVVKGGLQNSTATLNLSAPAPPSGLIVNLNSSDGNVAAVPQSVTVLGNAQSATFMVQTKKVPDQRLVTISAVAAQGVSASATLTVNPPALTGLSFNPGIVTAGQQTKGTMTFESGVATGTIVTLQATPSSALTVPSTVAVTGGSKTYSFFATANSVLVDTDVTVTAFLGDSQATTTVTVHVASVLSLTFDPPRVTGGKTAVGTVTLDGPAPPQGVTVTITSGNTQYAKVVGNNVVTIPSGKRIGTFTVSTSKVSRTVGVVFTGTISSGGVVTGTLYIDP